MLPFLKKLLGNIYAPLAWSLIIGILLALPGSMLPNENKFAIPGFDKVVHIGMFGGFVFLWNLYLARYSPAPEKLLRMFFYVYVLGNLYGIGMEYVQKYFIPLRDYDTGDIIADMIGAGLAYGVSNLFLIEVKDKK